MLELWPGSSYVAVELLGVVDVRALAMDFADGGVAFSSTSSMSSALTSEAYLKRIAITFPKSGAKCTTEKGRPEEVITEKAGEKTTPVTMATHGRSGLNRFLVGQHCGKGVARGNRSHITG